MSRQCHRIAISKIHQPCCFQSLPNSDKLKQTMRPSRRCSWMPIHVPRKSWEFVGETPVGCLKSLAGFYKTTINPVVLFRKRLFKVVWSVYGFQLIHRQTAPLTNMRPVKFFARNIGSFRFWYCFTDHSTPQDHLTVDGYTAIFRLNKNGIMFGQKGLGYNTSIYFFLNQGISNVSLRCLCMLRYRQKQWNPRQFRLFGAKLFWWYNGMTIRIRRVIKRFPPPLTKPLATRLSS